MIKPCQKWLDLDSVFFSPAASIKEVTERELIQGSGAKGRWYKDIKALQEHNLSEPFQFWVFAENAVDGNQQILQAITRMKHRFGLRTEEGLV